MANMTDRIQKFLKAASVEGGKTLKLTIKDVLFDVPIGQGSNKTVADVLTFDEDHRQLVVKPCHTIAMTEISGSKDSDDWIGIEVEAYEAQTQFQGRVVNALRLRKAA